MTGRRWLRGLRARLLVAFLTVTVLGAAAAAWASARSASTALVDGEQRRISATIVGQVRAVTPQLSYPPDRAALDRLRTVVGANTVVSYRRLRSVDGPETRLVTPALRTAVRERGRTVTQRVTAADGRPWLLVGMPIVRTAPNGARTPSGIELYTARSLGGVEAQIDDLSRSAARTVALTLPLAALLALVAARSVLRPVRELRDTARRLADGDLDARTSPRGADEVAQLTLTINEMADAIQTSMTETQRMQADAERFVADVSHELRTPLSTLTAVTSVLAIAADGAEPDAREAVQLAIAETDRLVRLVEDLIEVSRFDAGTAVRREEPVDVVAAVRDCLAARGWTNQVELAAPDALAARLDRRRLDVIVANLVGNALRHGGPPVRVEIAATPQELQIAVTDGGPGLPADVVERVFDRFYKADAARARTPGSGLGLSIARENARLHRGELTAGNAAGGGARFVLRLPRDRDPEAAPRTHATPSPAPEDR
jgi:two-component system sensor histidine kinase MtrB